MSLIPHKTKKRSKIPAMLKWFLLLISIPIALFAGCQVTSFIDAISLANYRAEQIAFGTQVAVEKNCLLEQGLSGGYTGRLAFDSDGKMAILDLTTMNYITQSPVNVMSNPDWNPTNGRELILGEFQVYLLDTVSWQITRLVEGGQPSWSPDGTQLVYSRRQRDSGLYIYDLSSRTRRILPIERRTFASPYNPVWSPDGQTIAFAMPDSDRYVEIFSIPSNCSDSQGCPLTQLTDLLGEGQSRDPSWSPDGTHITFASSRSGGWEIYVMKADGTNVQQLTESPIPSQIWDNSPTYSPDGEYIAFTRTDNIVGGPGGENIYVMQIDGSNPTCLSSMPGRQPDWTDL
jgi:dipeptidyl aminopeptidase/acylaminoacyl peptidase